MAKGDNFTPATGGSIFHQAFNRAKMPQQPGGGLQLGGMPQNLPMQPPMGMQSPIAPSPDMINRIRMGPGMQTPMPFPMPGQDQIKKMRY